MYFNCFDSKLFYNYSQVHMKYRKNNDKNLWKLIIWFNNNAHALCKISLTFSMGVLIKNS